MLQDCTKILLERAFTIEDGPKDTEEVDVIGVNPSVSLLPFFAMSLHVVDIFYRTSLVYSPDMKTPDWVALVKRGSQWWAYSSRDRWAMMRSFRKRKSEYICDMLVGPERPSLAIERTGCAEENELTEATFKGKFSNRSNTERRTQQTEGIPVPRSVAPLHGFESAPTKLPD